jgi:hypothetical protein
VKADSTVSIPSPMMSRVGASIRVKPRQQWAGLFSENTNLRARRRQP